MLYVTSRTGGAEKGFRYISKMCFDLIKETGESIILAGYDFDNFDHVFGCSFPHFRNTVCVIMKSVIVSVFDLSIIVIFAFFVPSKESSIFYCFAVHFNSLNVTHQLMHFQYNNILI